MIAESCVWGKRSDDPKDFQSVGTCRGRGYPQKSLQRRFARTTPGEDVQGERGYFCFFHSTNCGRGGDAVVVWIYLHHIRGECYYRREYLNGLTGKFGML